MTVLDPVTYSQITRDQLVAVQARHQSLKVARPTTLTRLPLRGQAWYKVVSSPLKERCLKQCRNPFSFFVRYYRKGSGAAWPLGLQHGMFCLGCYRRPCCPLGSSVSIPS